MYISLISFLIFAFKICTVNYSCILYYELLFFPNLNLYWTGVRVRKLVEKVQGAPSVLPILMNYFIMDAQSDSYFSHYFLKIAFFSHEKSVALE